MFYLAGWRQHLFSAKFFPSLCVWGETFAHTTFRVSLKKYANKFNAACFSALRCLGKTNFILRKEGGNRKGGYTKQFYCHTLDRVIGNIFGMISCLKISKTNH